MIDWGSYRQPRVIIFAAKNLKGERNKERTYINCFYFFVCFTIVTLILLSYVLINSETRKKLFQYNLHIIYILQEILFKDLKKVLTLLYVVTNR